MLNLVKRVTTDETGASSAEYGILVALVAGVVLIAIPLFGTGMNAMFTKLGTYLTGLIP
jgi:pilus assembly protein Flp/PilA